METVAPVKPMGKFRASYLLTVESLELLRKDKEILWYVVWDSLAVFALTAAFIAILVTLDLHGMTIMDTRSSDATGILEIVGYVALFAFYLIGAFITTFFNVALTYVVAGRIAGEDRTYRDGIRAATARFGKILKWSILTATVGVVLRVIGNKLGWAGKLFSFVGGVAWAVATFFIVPVLALENEGVGTSVKRSSQTFVKTWGETIIMNFSTGIFFAGIYFFVVALALLLAYFFIESMLLLSILGVAVVMAFVILTLVQTTLSAVIKVVLYHYAVYGKVPDSFTPELIMGVLKKKEQHLATV